MEKVASDYSIYVVYFCLSRYKLLALIPLLLSRFLPFRCLLPNVFCYNNNPSSDQRIDTDIEQQKFNNVNKCILADKTLHRGNIIDLELFPVDIGSRPQI